MTKMGQPTQRRSLDLVVNIAVLLTLAIVLLSPSGIRAQATTHGVTPAWARLSETPIFDSGEHSNVAVSVIGSLSRGMIVHDERIVLLDGRTLLFINPWTGELWTAGGQGEGPGEFAGSGLELSLFRGQDELRVWDPNNDRRLTIFSDTGELQDTRRVNLSGVAFRHWTASMMGVFPDGSFAFIDRDPPPIVGASDGRQRTLGYVVEVNEEGKRRVIAEFLDSEGGSVLFRYRTVISFDGDRVSLADTESDEIRIIDRSGRTVSRIPMPGQRVRVSSAQLDAARAEAQVRLRRGHEITLRQLEAMGWPTTENVQSRERDYLHNEVAPSVDRTQFDAESTTSCLGMKPPGGRFGVASSTCFRSKCPLATACWTPVEISCSSESGTHWVSTEPRFGDWFGVWVRADRS